MRTWTATDIIQGGKPSGNDFGIHQLRRSVKRKELTYGWQAPRRLVVVRETLRERPEARGRKLLEVPGYTFHVLVTTLSHDPVQTWRFYNSRAESENRIKELKEDFGAGGFCLQSFDGTEAAFRLIYFLFNLIADFKREVTQDDSPQLMTLRTRLLVIGAIRGAEGRKPVLRLGLRGRWRQRFQALLARIAALAVSTVAQFTAEQKKPSPRPWKPRSHPVQPRLLWSLK